MAAPWVPVAIGIGAVGLSSAAFVPTLLMYAEKKAPNGL
jgi:hypothetical protein